MGQRPRTCGYSRLMAPYPSVAKVSWGFRDTTDGECIGTGTQRNRRSDVVKCSWKPRNDNVSPARQSGQGVLPHACWLERKQLDQPRTWWNRYLTLYYVWVSLWNPHVLIYNGHQLSVHFFLVQLYPSIFSCFLCTTAYFTLWRRCFPLGFHHSPRSSHSCLPAFLTPGRCSLPGSPLVPFVLSRLLDLSDGIVWCITSFGVYGHSVFDTFVQLTEGRSARDIPKQPPAKKRRLDDRQSLGARTAAAQKKYLTSSFPHHDMLGGGCLVRVVI